MRLGASVNGQGCARIGRKVIGEDLTPRSFHIHLPNTRVDARGRAKKTYTYQKSLTPSRGFLYREIKMKKGKNKERPIVN